MLGAIPIEIVGEDIGVRLLLVGIPAALLAGAAVLAARIARQSAIERQKEQLDQDFVKQEKALAHDRQMREEERAYDREMRSRERSLDTLDDVLANVEAARLAVTSYSAATEVANKARAKSAKTAADQEASEDEKTFALENGTRLLRQATEDGRVSHQSLQVLRSDHARLELRFGNDDSITKTQEGIRKCLREWEKLADVILAEQRDWTDEERALEEEVMKRLAVLTALFRNECRTWESSES